MMSVIRFILLMLDILLCMGLAVVFVGWLAAVYLCNRTRSFLRSGETRPRRMLYIVASRYRDLEQKGVLWMIKDREERGYFDRIYTIHPFVWPTRRIISDNNILIEYGPNWYDRLKALGLRYTSKLLVVFGLLSLIVRLIQTENLRIIRSTDPYVAGLIGLASSRLTRVPFCVSIHSDYDLSLKNTGQYPKFLGSQRLSKNMARFVLSHADMVMPIRDSLAQYAIRNGAKSERIRIIPHGIDLSQFQRLPDSGRKTELGVEDKKVVSFVGRLSKDNYSYDLIEIAYRVCQQRSDTVFLIVGDGTERETLHERARSLGVDDNVRFLGFQSRDKVVQVRLASDVAICLMGGFSLIEAAAAGNPLIAYDVDWHYELVKNNETGFLVHEGDIKGAANAILLLLDNAQLSQTLGGNARKLVLARHSREKASEITITWYEELFGGKRSS